MKPLPDRASGSSGGLSLSARQARRSEGGESSPPSAITASVSNFLARYTIDAASSNIDPTLSML